MKARFSEVELDHLGDEIWEEAVPRATAALDKGVEVVVGAIKQNLRRRRGTAKTAAPPGQPPEYDEGDLERSVQPGKVRKRKYDIRKYYSVDHPSGLLHEYGGQVGNRLYPPRPFVRPAEEATETAVDAILEAL